VALTTAGPELDVVVVGAGVIGLAIARQLAMEGRDVVLLERESTFGRHTSSRNSEVIHAGIYYPPQSLKTRLCVRGRHLLYAYAQARGVEARKLGKLIVATREEEREVLQQLLERGVSNGIPDLELWDAARVSRCEPALRTCGALWSPSTGILDSHGFMRALLDDATAHGASIAWRATLRRVVPHAEGFVLLTHAERTSCRVLINTAGLDAIDVARGIEGLDPAWIPRLHLAKGNYFRIEGPTPFSHLVYPTPDPGALGIHVTLDLSGRARFGPDLQWIDALDYAVDDARVPAFEAAIARYWPTLPRGRLRPDYVGIRPKISGPGEPAADFRIDGPAQHGIPGLVNLFGIESPGLTAALAIAEHVCGVLSDHG